MCGGAVLAAFVLTGCNNAPVTTPEPVDDVRLGDSIDISLADWLKKPREELAQMVKETQDAVRRHDEEDRADRDGKLLPKLLPPITLPVMQECTFSPKLDISLPPYLKEGKYDADLALHLARHGDVEAALKVASPGDNALREKIESWRTERNYPVEWTQLVALTLSAAQLKVATDDVVGATELVLLHKQLQEILGSKTAAGPLGALLLPMGRRALTDSVVAWKSRKPALSNDVDFALSKWGDLPGSTPGLKPGDSQERVVRILGRKAEGFTITASTPDAVKRAVDLLSLPIVSDSVSGVVAFLDDHKTLSELVLLYRPRIGDRYPEPVNLGHHLADRSFETKTLSKSTRTPRQQFVGGGLSYEIAIMPLPGLGATVRIHDARTSPVSGVVGADGRDLGVAHLDGTYEQCRIMLGVESDPRTLTSEKPEALARLRSPVPAKPKAVIVQRAGDKNLIQLVMLRWAASVNLTAQTDLLLPLWSAHGDARVEEDADGTGLSFIWENAQTRCSLQLSFDVSQPPEYTALDRQGADRLSQREKEAHVFDQSQRKIRLQANRGLEFLPRALRIDLLGPQAADVHLGQTRARIKALLPSRSQAAQVFDIPDGYGVLFTIPAPEKATFWPQQLFVRFGAADRVNEVRVRYLESPREGAPTLYTLLRKEAGYPEKLPAPWERLWSDLGSQTRPSYYRWFDDRSVLTYQRDAGGLEVVLRAWPEEQTLQNVGTPLEFCSRGVAGCLLGDEREAVLKYDWRTKPGASSDGGVILYPKGPKSVYDTLVVYFENDKVVRITGRHKTRPMEASALEAIRQAWGADLAHLGSLRRADDAAGLQFLGACGWHDDRTRVRTFAQRSNGGAELWTEWRGWPLPVKQ
jgi:hypothetical protein